MSPSSFSFLSTFSDMKNRSYASMPLPGECADYEENPSWSEWLDEAGPTLMLYARQQTRSEADAEDVLQDALVQLVQAVEGGTFQGGPRQWRSFVFTAIRHKAIDYGRRAETRKNYEENNAEDMTVLEEPWLSAESDKEDMREDVESALRKLPQEQAEVVVLKIWGELTFQEIAERTGQNLSTITSRYRYAMTALRGVLAEYKDLLS